MKVDPILETHLNVLMWSKGLSINDSALILGPKVLLVFFFPFLPKKLSGTLREIDQIRNISQIRGAYVLFELL